MVTTDLCRMVMDPIDLLKEVDQKRADNRKPSGEVISITQNAYLACIERAICCTALGCSLDSVYTTGMLRKQVEEE